MIYVVLKLTLTFNILYGFTQNFEEPSKIKSKIMNHITQDFQSRLHLVVGGEERQRVVLKIQ